MILTIIVCSIIAVIITYFVGNINGCNEGYERGFGDAEKMHEFLTKLNSEHNITINVQDDEYTIFHLDDDKTIIGIRTCHPGNMNNFDFYMSLFTRSKIIKIVYNLIPYHAMITELQMSSDGKELSVYYKILEPIIKTQNKEKKGE